MTYRRCVAATALLVLGSAPAQASPASRPLHLVVENIGAGTRLSIFGKSETGCVTPYRLDVSSGAPSARNRSVQRGVARLLPGTPLIVASSTFAGRASESWSARLSVDGCHPGGSYEEQAAARP